MKVCDVCAAMEELAPGGFTSEWDKSGLSIGDPAAEVRSVLVALDVTRVALQAARKARAEMIVSHHPVIWDPLRVLHTGDPHTRLCLDLANANIACFAAHTNLDVVPGGVNRVLAGRLQLRNVKPLFSTPAATQVKLVTFVPETHLERVRDAVCAAGAGVIGNYTHCSFSTPGRGTFLPGDAARPFSGQKHRVNEEPELRFETLAPKARLDGVLAALKAAHPYEEVAYDLVRLENLDPSIGLGARGELEVPVTLDRFARTVRKALAVTHVRVVGEPRRTVRRVAVLGGSGGGEAARIPGDIDVYVTGDVRYHEALAAEARGLALIDAGHVGTERWIVPALAAHLRRKLKPLRIVAFPARDVFRPVTG